MAVDRTLPEVLDILRDAHSRGDIIRLSCFSEPTLAFDDFSDGYDIFKHTLSSEGNSTVYKITTYDDMRVPHVIFYSMISGHFLKEFERNIYIDVIGKRHSLRGTHEIYGPNRRKLMCVDYTFGFVLGFVLQSPEFFKLYSVSRSALSSFMSTDSLVVNHKNSLSCCCEPWNLELVSTSQNIRHAKFLKELGSCTSGIVSRRCFEESKGSPKFQNILSGDWFYTPLSANCLKPKSSISKDHLKTLKTHCSDGDLACLIYKIKPYYRRRDSLCKYLCSLLSESDLSLILYLEG